MKGLTQFIQEGNIDYTERKYREFCGMCRAYNVNPEDISVCQTSKGNWKVCDAEGKKIFLVSRNILDDEIITAKGLKRYEVNCE